MLNKLKSYLFKASLQGAYCFKRKRKNLMTLIRNLPESKAPKWCDNHIQVYWYLPTSPTLLMAKKSVPATRSVSPIRGFKPSKRQIQVCVIVDTVLINNNVKFSVMN